MQNVILYYLVSGPVWFLCQLAFLVIIVQDLRGAFIQKPLLRATVRLLLLALLALAALSGTPVPWWLAILGVVIGATYIAMGFSSTQTSSRLVLGIPALGLAATALVLEAPFYFTRAPQMARPKRVYIIGDSLTAGMGGETVTWPKKLRELTSIRIMDLSFAGADAASALAKQANIIERDAEANDWVLICIGGNDMLGRTKAADFGVHLDQLLAAARGDPALPRTVVMLELPIVPGAWSFAAWQRELAQKHGVVLVPKRLLAGVVLHGPNVTDGLHLSKLGHERMAEQILPWLGIPDGR